MDTTNLTPGERQQRMNVRNFLLAATLDELRDEMVNSLDMGDTFRAKCVLELIVEKRIEEKE